MHQRDAAAAMAGAADVDRTIVGSIIPFAETKRLDSFCSTPCLLKDDIAKECVYMYMYELVPWDQACLVVRVALLRCCADVAIAFLLFFCLPSPCLSCIRTYMYVLDFMNARFLNVLQPQ